LTNTRGKRKKGGGISDNGVEGTTPRRKKVWGLGLSDSRESEMRGEKSTKKLAELGGKRLVGPR